jgi:hypothetical protein
VRKRRSAAAFGHGVGWGRVRARAGGWGLVRAWEGGRGSFEGSSGLGRVAREMAVCASSGARAAVGAGSRALVATWNGCVYEKIPPAHRSPVTTLHFG